MTDHNHSERGLLCDEEPAGVFCGALHYFIISVQNTKTLKC